MSAGSLTGSINGLLSGVFAFAGLQLFVEFMAEMRRPHDFLKVSAHFSWCFICWSYNLCLLYCLWKLCILCEFLSADSRSLLTIFQYQGQYTFNPSFLGVSNYGWQTAGNILVLLSGLIAAGLYGNIGIKVFYNNVLIDIFKAPPLTPRRGKIIYAVIVPIWWIIAFIIAAAIPAYIYFTSIMAASCLLNLSYTIPTWLALGYDIKRLTIGGFDPTIGRISRAGVGIRRHINGFFAGGPSQTLINIWHLLFLLASLGLCGLGMYASIEGWVFLTCLQQ